MGESDSNGDSPIRIRSYDPEWASRYATEQAALEDAIGEWTVGGIHHIGSTSVPGVDADPVVDILVGTESLGSARACFPPLSLLGYVLERREGAGLHSFAKPSLANRQFSLHLVPIGEPYYTEMLAFRDFLRADRQVAIGFAGMKRDLAGRHADDRQRYRTAKAELIQAVLACARALP